MEFLEILLFMHILYINVYNILITYNIGCWSCAYRRTGHEWFAYWSCGCGDERDSGRKEMCDSLYNRRAPMAAGINWQIVRKLANLRIQGWILQIDECDRWLNILYVGKFWYLSSNEVCLILHAFDRRYSVWFYTCSPFISVLKSTYIELNDYWQYQ